MANTNSISSRWAKHIKDPVKKEVFLKTIRGSHIALERLAQLIDEDLNTMSVGEGTLKDFEDPSWSHKQAYRNGYRALARDILNLINLTK